MTRTLEAKLLLTGSDKTGKATGSAARGLENVAKTAKRAEDAWKRTSAAQRAMATNVRTNAREVERLQRGMQVNADKHVQQIKRINGAVRNLRSSVSAADGAMIGFSGRFLATAGTIMAATKAFNDYASAQDQLDRTGLTGGADEKTMDVADDRMREIAQATGMSIAEVRSGLSTLVSTGMSVADSMAILQDVANAAQASGAAIDDVASSAQAAGASFKIAAEDMKLAFDVMAFGGQLGMFELDDMARYLPSLLPQAETRGYTGIEGLKRFISMLQVVRSESGTAENANSRISDLLNKMTSDDTTNNFEDFGIDIRKVVETAKAEGRDQVNAFLDAVNQAIGTDYDKLNLLLGDKEARLAALTLAKNRDQVEQYVKAMDEAGGTVEKNLARLTDNLEQEFQRVNNAINEVSEATGKMMESFGLPEGLKQTTAMLETIAGQIETIAGREGGLIEELTGRNDGLLEKLATPIGPDGLVSKSLFGWINEQTDGALDWIVDDSERVTPPIGDGSPGAFYEMPTAQFFEESLSGTADFLLGQKRVPVPAPAPGRAPASAPFQMQPSDMTAPILVSDYPVPRGRPRADEVMQPVPWDAFALPRGRPGPEEGTSMPPVASTLPFPMRAEVFAAPIVAAAGPPPLAVQGLVDGVERAAGAVEQFRAALDGGSPARHLTEMDDDALLAALSGGAPAAAVGGIGNAPQVAVVGIGDAPQAAVDEIGDAADAAVGKLEQLPAAMKPEAFAAAGHASMAAFEGAVDAGIARVNGKLSAASAQWAKSASFSASPRIAPVGGTGGRPAAVDADRGASMPNISERLP